MKFDPKAAKKDPRPKTVRKTIIINGFTGEEREADLRRIKVIDGMEIGDTRVELDNGVKLTIVSDGKYTTMGKPQERWGEVVQVRVRPDGDYEDGELLGWTPLFSPSAEKKPAPQKPSKPAAPKKPASAKTSPKAPAKGGSAQPVRSSRPAKPDGRKASAPGKLAPRPKTQK